MLLYIISSMASGLSIVSSVCSLLTGLLPSRFISSPEDPTTPSNPAAIGNDLVREILKFLPVKSLMRFKCVSRNWLSIITDPSFTGAYRGGFRGPILIPINGLRDLYTVIYCVSIDETGPTSTRRVFHHSTVDHGGAKRFWHTGFVNGLVCFYLDDESWLYNIATRERVQLPAAEPFPNNDGAEIYTRCSYQFGFDPVSKLYKLLRVSAIYDSHEYLCEHPLAFYCQIVTIGVDSSWRVIHSMPPKELTFRGLCLDGVLYGMENRANYCFLTVFDFVGERFQPFPLPPDEFDPPRTFCYSLDLPSFCPGPGPVLTSNGNRPATARIYRYSFGGRDKVSEGTWDIELLALPDRNVFPEGILPSGKMLIADFIDPEPPRLFLYDPFRNKYEKLVSSGDTPVDPRGGVFYYIEENIVSLKCLISSST